MDLKLFFDWAEKIFEQIFVLVSMNSVKSRTKEDMRHDSSDLVRENEKHWVQILNTWHLL